ncbi:transcription elongation factor GreA, partial [Patescibacteria group bacterium]
MKKKIQLTKSGLEKLKKELEKLVNEKRPKVVERLAYARSQGDLSENSDYTNAKEELEFTDGRIEKLEEVVATAEVVKNGSNGDGAGIGAKITVKTNGDKLIFDMVGEWEADP